jgi:hypothetical protein
MRLFTTTYMYDLQSSPTSALTLEEEVVSSVLTFSPSECIVEIRLTITTGKGNFYD